MDKLLGGDGLQSIISGAMIGAVVAAGSVLLTPKKETLSDLNLDIDFLAQDQQFMDAFAFLKPYRHVDQGIFDALVKHCNTLASLYFSIEQGSTLYNLQIKSLGLQNQIKHLAEQLSTRVRRTIPQEAASTADYVDALNNVVQTYVDNIQYEMIGKVPIVNQ